MIVFSPLVFVQIGQFCRDVIGPRQKVKVVVIGRFSVVLLLFSIRLLFVCQFRLRSCMSRL